MSCDVREKLKSESKTQVYQVWQLVLGYPGPFWKAYQKLLPVYTVKQHTKVSAFTDLLFSQFLELTRAKEADRQTEKII